jgi:ABC-type branched-subunit amino acid transport system ATPase component
VRLFGDQTVLDNVRLGAYRRTPSGILSGMFGAFGHQAAERDREEKAWRWLDFVSLSGLAGRRAEDLSFGQQRLLELARALALEPSLLLLDEPASGLNDKETAGFSELIRGLKKLGITVLIVEHNMDLMMRVADRILVLDRGRTVTEGTPAEVQCDPRVINIYLGTEETQ